MSAPLAPDEVAALDHEPAKMHRAMAAACDAALAEIRAIQRPPPSVLAPLNGRG